MWSIDELWLDQKSVRSKCAFCKKCVSRVLGLGYRCRERRDDLGQFRNLRHRRMMVAFSFTFVLRRG